MKDTEEIKKQIIDVADIRFRRYGFGKTTIAEIAKECRMSSANVYRYFENKEMIGVEITLKCFHNIEKLGREVLQREGLTASGRLEIFFLEILRYTNELCVEHVHLFELVDFISKEHSDIVGMHEESLRSILAEILAGGNRNGEFNVTDIVATAETILFATVHFYYPPLVTMKNYSLEELEHAEKAVIGLLIQGLAKH